MMSETEIDVPWYKGNAFFLLVILISIQILHPILNYFSQDSQISRVVFDIMIFGAIILAIRAVTKNTHLYHIGLALSFITLLGRWVIVPERFRVVILILWSAFLLFVCFLLLAGVLRAPKVKTDMIFAAASVYFLMGIAWGMVFTILFELDPTAFRFPDPEQTDHAAHLIQFSFTTLTTLGYGDIAPRTILARSFANLEAILGQLYVALLLARLVSLHVAHSHHGSRGCTT